MGANARGDDRWRRSSSGRVAIGVHFFTSNDGELAVTGDVVAHARDFDSSATGVGVRGQTNVSAALGDIDVEGGSLAVGIDFNVTRQRDPDPLGRRGRRRSRCSVGRVRCHPRRRRSVFGNHRKRRGRRGPIGPRRYHHVRHNRGHGRHCKRRRHSHRRWSSCHRPGRGLRSVRR